MLQQFKTRTQAKHAAVTAQAVMTSDDVAPSSSSDELILLLSVAPGMSETDVWSTPAAPASAFEEPSATHTDATSQQMAERVISTAHGPIRATRGVKPIRMIPESAYKSDAAQTVYPSKLTSADDDDGKRRARTDDGGEWEEEEDKELLVRGTRKNCTPSDENGRDVLTAINPVFGATVRDKAGMGYGIWNMGCRTRYDYVSRPAGGGRGAGN